ncbi:hypothetical protein ACFL0L_04435 [Patescibacteria group bacterium]
MKYFWGIIIVGIGFMIVWKSDWFMNNFGRIEFAEKYLGSGWGGTRIFYKLIGIAIIILAFMWMSGALESILGSMFGPTQDALRQ